MIIDVDLSCVAAAEEGYQQVCNALQAEIDNLTVALQASLAEWTGEARSAYDTAHAQWQAAMDSMVKSLAWLHGVVRTAGGNYGNARAANLNMWQVR